MRKEFYSRGKKLSYIDTGGANYPIIALHGHFGCATMFNKLATQLVDRNRVIALDQQGHGFSNYGNSYSRQGYIQDLENLMNELEIERAVLIGHSLGGVNAYQFAAANPQRVQALIIEDIGTKIDDDLSFILGWPASFTTIREVMAFLESVGIDNPLYFMESLSQAFDGWKFMFDRIGIVKSQEKLNGDWTKDWNRVQCELLLLHGTYSKVLSEAQFRELSKAHNVTSLAFNKSGHTIRDVEFEKYLNAIRDFLEKQCWR